MWEILDKDFFKSDTISLAQNLVGKWIETNINGNITIAQISETEAYLGITDSACHTFGGKRTARTEPMWQEGGTIYVYLCYGLHHLLNIVSKDVGEPEAVLIRAVVGAEGPAKLTKLLGVDKSFNGEHIVCNPRIRILDDGKKYAFDSKPRIGIDYAKKEDRCACLRFVLINKGEK